MFNDAFEKLDLAEVATLLDQLNPLFEGIEFDPVETTIMAVNVPFYEGFRFFEIYNHTVSPAVQRFVLHSQEQTVVLNYTNEPIYALNKALPIKLNDENVHEYLKFFFFIVKGRHGRFLISETVDDVNWREEPPPAARKAIGKMLMPVTLKDVGEGGVYEMEATMVFKDSLFRSDINISAEGSVSLTNEELLIEDMPVLDDVFGQ